MGNTLDLSLEAYYKRVKYFVDYKSGAVLVMNENLADELVGTENRSYGVELMALHAFVHIVGQREGGTGLSGDLAAGFH